MLTGVTRVTSMAAAGVGVIRNRLRKAPLLQSSEQLLCNSTRPISALTAKAVIADENDLVMEAGEPVLRFVFGGVPNLEESKEATADLKEALDEMYLSSEISLPLNTEIVDNRSSSNPRVEHVHTAFRLLRIPEIQNVVASIASDQTVQGAVAKNPEFAKFIHAFQTISDTSEDEENVTQEEKSKASDMEKPRNLKDFVVKMVTNIPSHLPSLFGSSAEESGSESDDKENTTTKGGKFGLFMEKLRNVKNSVVEMATNIPNYLPNFYGSSVSESVSGSNNKENSEGSLPELGLGTSLTGLAIMVIMIVVFKRV